MHRVANNLEEYREGIVHLKVFLDVLTVLKTCEESFTTPTIPANETLENFIPSDFSCEM